MSLNFVFSCSSTSKYCVVIGQVGVGVGVPVFVGVCVGVEVSVAVGVGGIGLSVGVQVGFGVVQLSNGARHLLSGISIMIFKSKFQPTNKSS
jgi:hypothetical protein